MPPYQSLEIYRMHNQGIGSTGMDPESHLAQDNTYGSEHWVDMNTYSHPQTTLPDYSGGYGYMPPITHGLPSESLGRMPPPPPPQSMQPPHQSPYQPLTLLVPSNPTWPSMLTNPNSYSNQPVAIPPVPAPLKTTKVTPLHAPSGPRKTLTDDDRRRMCQYHEDNPHVKQTEIGAMFGVERR